MARKIEVQITGDTKGLSRAFDDASGSTSKFGGMLGSLAKGSILAVGAGLGGLALGLGSSVKAAAAFESSLNSLQAVTGATGKQMEKVSERARALGRDITLPGTSAKDAAEAMTELSKGGLSVAQSMSAAKGVLQLAAAAEIGNAEAATIAARALNAFGLEGGEAGRVADVLANAANASTGEITDFAAGLQQSAAVAKQWGLSINETTAALMELADAGIVGSDAGTSLKTMLQSLSPTAAPAKAAMKELGVDVFDASGKFVGIQGTVKQFTAGLKGMSQEQQTAALKTIFGSDAVRAANIILGQGSEKLGEYIAKTEQSGSAAKLAAAKMQGFKGSMEAIRSSVETLQIELGTMLLPVLTRAADAFSNFLAKFSAAKGIKAKLEVVWEGVQAAGAALTTKIGEAVAMIDWAAVWGKAQGIGAGLAAKLEATDWSAVGSAIGDGIAKGVGTAGEIGKKLAAAVNTGMNAVDWSALGAKMGPGLALAVVVAFNTLMDPAFWIRNWELVLGVAVVAFTGPIGKLGTALLKPFAKIGGDAVLALVGAIETVSPRIATVVLAAFTKLPGLVSGALEKLASLVGSVFGRLGRLAVFTAKVLGVTAVINAVADMATAIYGKLQDILGWFRDLPGQIKGVFSGAAGWLVGAGTAVLQGFWDGLKSKWDAVAGWVGGLGDKIKGLKGPESKDATLLEPEGKAIILGLETGMMASWATLAPKISALGGNIISNFILGISAKQPEFTGKMAQAASAALESARAAVEAAQGRFAEAFGKLGDMAKRVFEERTRGMLDKLAAEFNLKVAAIDAFKASLTPAELALKQLDAAESASAKNAALVAAEKAVAAAQTIADETERNTALIAAKEQLRVAELAITRSGLEERANAERVDRDATVALQIAFLEQQKAKELQNLEERRAQLAAKLDEQLAVLVEKLSAHPKEYGKTMAAITKLLAGYGITLKNSGLALGNAFAAGLRAAGKNVEAAAEALAKIVAKYLKLKSPAEKGPLSSLDSWFKPMGPMLAAQMNGMTLAGGAASMAGGASARMGGGYAARGGGSTVVQIHLNGTVFGDDRRAAEQIYGALVDVDRSRGGKLFNNTAPALT